jgi:hypothetical protein
MYSTSALKNGPEPASWRRPTIVEEGVTSDDTDMTMSVVAKRKFRDFIPGILLRALFIHTSRAEGFLMSTMPEGKKEKHFLFLACIFEEIAGKTRRCSNVYNNVDFATSCLG